MAKTSLKNVEKYSKVTATQIRKNLREDLRRMKLDTRCIRAVEDQIELDYDVQTRLDEIGLNGYYD